MNATAIYPAPSLSDGLPETKFRREQRAFHRLLPELLKRHRGQYVCIHDEQVVDSGPMLEEVAKRAFARFGYLPFYIELVSDQPVPPIRFGVYREIPTEPTT